MGDHPHPAPAATTLTPTISSSTTAANPDQSNRKQKKKTSMVQVSVKKVTSLLAFLLVIMLLMMALPPASAPAPTLMKKNDNGTTFRCNNGFMDEEEGEESCRLIANDYSDMEFMMGTGISRMLDDKPPSYLGKNALKSKMAVGCGRQNKGMPYTPCSSQEREGKIPETTSSYKRGNNPPKSP
ncbi:hypothetical protein I3842_14G103800 [Carya illinoinensis]|uniref:Uncharacterized protein n=1 Tax=Carya illinoinensis TaxID=32201 RepID=A0A922ACH5_CARIL|nr:hypothetical protein I3842_14G103800 [Carya illinoinensis]